MSEVAEITPKLEPRAVVAHRLGVSESTVKRLVRDGKLAKPLKVTAQRVCWRSSDVDDFIRSLEAK
jgi:predicted DNA-binding transcriptional regulator AlpA